MSAKSVKVGVGWKKQTRDGAEFISIVITNPLGPDLLFTLFPVEERRGERSPDYNVVKSSYQPPAGGGSQPTFGRDREPGDDQDAPF